MPGLTIGSVVANALNPTAVWPLRRTRRRLRVARHASRRRLDAALPRATRRSRSQARSSRTRSSCRRICRHARGTRVLHGALLRRKLGGQLACDVCLRCRLRGYRRGGRRVRRGVAAVWWRSSASESRGSSARRGRREATSGRGKVEKAGRVERAAFDLISVQRDRYLRRVHQLHPPLPRARDSQRRRSPRDRRRALRRVRRVRRRVPQPRIRRPRRPSRSCATLLASGRRVVAILASEYVAALHPLEPAEVDRSARGPRIRGGRDDGARRGDRRRGLRARSQQRR